MQKKKTSKAKIKTRAKAEPESAVSVAEVLIKYLDERLGRLETHSPQPEMGPMPGTTDELPPPLPSALEIERAENHLFASPDATSKTSGFSDDLRRGGYGDFANPSSQATMENFMCRLERVEAGLHVMVTKYREQSQQMMAVLNYVKGGVDIKI